MTILNDLKIKEKFEKRTLNKYEDLLYKTFQVIYEVDAFIEWERIFRFSPTSNFIMVSGTALVAEGQKLPSGTNIDNDLVLEVSFTVPWEMLDDGSSAYQIADAAKSIGVARSVSTPKEFHNNLRDVNFTMATLQELLPDIEKLAKQAQEEPDITTIKLPPHLDGFDLSGLTEEQKQSLMLSEVTRK
jgi:hypothetical protein